MQGTQELMGLLENSGYTQKKQEEPANSHNQVQKLMVGVTLDIYGIKSLVIKYQNTDKGFYCYQDWIKLHQVIFQLKSQFMTQMWRTLKLVNFGDEYIPTGLIFDTLVTLFNVQKKSEEIEKILKKLFFEFIEINGKVLLDTEKEEIYYLKILRRLAENYKQIIKNRLYENANRDKSQKTRYQKLYELHNLYTYKKNLQKLKKIQDDLKQCSFEPNMNDSRIQNIESKYMQPAKTYESPVLQEEYYEPKIFRAQPVPQYPLRYPQGFTNHVTRMNQYIEEQTKKYNLKPSYGFKNGKQFSIEQRNSIRKLNSMNRKKVLFLISIEVGKKKLTLKVREGMTQEQVVNEIELMVGFKDNQIAQIVEQYYINYFKKTNNIQI